MSIFGSSSYNSDYSLKESLANLYATQNVITNTHFTLMMQKLNSEFVEMVYTMLGDTIAWFGDERDAIIPKYESGSAYHTSTLSSINYSLYKGAGAVNYPFNLTKLAVENTRMAETYATYYCKFDTSPLPVYDVTNRFRYLRGALRTPFTYSGPSMEKDHSLAKYLFEMKSMTFGISDNDETPERSYKVPKIRVNTWRIPIFTDGHYNSVAFIRDLDVQIDFMPTPICKDYFTKNLESTHISVTGRGLFVGEDLERQEFDPSVGVYHTDAGQFISLYKAMAPGDFTTAAKRLVYSLNKRPNRHCRYRVSAYGFATKPNYPGVEEKFPAEWVKVEKVYDTEAEYPLSSGFTHPEYRGSDDSYGVVPEGISPDPEDLTNPMDVTVDFEFVQCKVDSNFNPIDTYDIDERTPKTLLGYLVLRAYSGLVGSTLQDGIHNPEDLKTTEASNNPVTSYDVKTRPHDVFFKVTLKAPKYQKMAGGNFFSIRRSSENATVEDIDAAKKWGWLKDNKIDFNKLELEVSDMEKRHFLETRIEFNEALEAPIYFAPTLSQIKTSEIFKDTDKEPGFIRPGFMTSYEKSPDFRWGEHDFYNYRIYDNGGFLRPSIHDTAYTLEAGALYSYGEVSGPINPATLYLECFEYSRDQRLQQMLRNINIGGKCLGGVMK